MNLSLIRDTFTETSTTGKLFIENDFECFVLEDQDRKLEAGIGALKGWFNVK